MTESHEAGPASDVPAGPARSRWPDVIGILGIILSVIIFIDKLDDLATLTWTQERWRAFIGADLADLVIRSLPPVGVRLVTSLAHMALAAILIAACLALRRRRRAGVARCRTWAGLAIVWVVLEIGWVAWWLAQRTEEMAGAAGISPAAWYGYAGFGIAVALVLLLAFPVFLLVWLGRSEVKAEYEVWPV